jgi:hypothetical protein
MLEVCICETSWGSLSYFEFGGFYLFYVELDALL